MTRIRKSEIENFRGIRSLEWHPSGGFNCPVGPGDGGRSTSLEAIDLGAGARRRPQFAGADFHRLDCDRHVAIRVTMGDRPSEFLSLEAHGHRLRGGGPCPETVEDEPGHGLETVLTVELRVDDDLEPRRSLVSGRAARAALERSLAWRDRGRLSHIRLSGTGGHRLGWSRASILNRLSDGRADVSWAMSRAARQARSPVKTAAVDELADALASVNALSVLLKGLEADVTVVPDADDLSAGNPHVALSRRARRPVACSRRPDPYARPVAP
ncbi:hypothetical protein [Antarcticirhabdus aurantiaca]|uniref:Uncharacterized protein n=1 Tax=Antarcticirhabdus aurantiaca TaxID=2606717 RepID=A0ACD4NRK1_9HYPH|nr:hypothetical protein [Antarcticirhabdus aurantiaca]WAJ29543.1 hypothetical protein OXU80_04725 [Jeongeuplla avenae]